MKFDRRRSRKTIASGIPSIWQTSGSKNAAFTLVKGDGYVRSLLQTNIILTEDHMRSRYTAILLSFAALSVAAYEYIWLQVLGFPDGHLTELDRSRIPLHSVFIGISTLCGISSLYFAATTSTKRRQIGMLAVIFFYLAAGLATLLIDWHLSSNLDAGTGG